MRHSRSQNAMRRASGRLGARATSASTRRRIMGQSLSSWVFLARTRSARAITATRPAPGKSISTLRFQSLAKESTPRILDMASILRRRRPAPRQRK